MWIYKLEWLPISKVITRGYMRMTLSLNIDYIKDNQRYITDKLRIRIMEITKQSLNK